MITKDNKGELVDKPLQIHVAVEDINDNPPVCQKALTIIEVQENEGGGKKTASTHLCILLVLLLFPAGCI